MALAYSFWRLVRNTISEMEVQGNKNTITSDYDSNLPEEKQWDKFKEMTKWNDINIGIPTLFNFYHGLELYMKGLIEIGGLECKNDGHKLKALFETIKCNEDKFSPEILKLLKKISLIIFMRGIGLFHF